MPVTVFTTEIFTIAHPSHLQNLPHRDLERVLERIQNVFSDEP